MDLEKLTRQMESLSNYTQRGTEYLKQENYYSAIAEFSKVIDSLPKALELSKRESRPSAIISLYIQLVRQALIGRQVAYLSIGEKEKARADEEKLKTIDTLSASTNIQSTLERIKAEEKKEEGSTLGGCLSIIFFIIIIYSWLR